MSSSLSIYVFLSTDKSELSRTAIRFTLKSIKERGINQNILNHLMCWLSEFKMFIFLTVHKGFGWSYNKQYMFVIPPGMMTTGIDIDIATDAQKT